MELIGSFSYFLGNLALYYVFIIFLINNLKSKLKKWQSFSIFAFVFFVLHLFVLIDVERYRLIFTFVPIFALFVLTGLLFANPIKEKLMLIAVGYSFLLFTSFSIDALIVLLVVDYNTPSVAVYAYVTMNFVYASLLAFFTYLRVKRVGKTAFRRNLLLFLVFPISQFLLLFTMSMIIAYTGIFTGEAMPIFIRSLFMLKVLVFLSIAAAILANLAFVYMIIRNADKNKIQEELRFQEYQNRLNLDYYRSIEADSKEIYKIKHDFMNVLQVMQTLFAKDDIQGNKYAEELLLELKKNIQNTYTAEYSQNPLVNAIVSNKLQVCENENIETDVNISLPQNLNIKDLDLCRALTNLLDNACNAVRSQTQGQKYIKIDIFIDSSYLYIKAENSKNKGDENQMLQRIQGEGLGLKILNNLADEYEGSFIFDDLENSFVAMLCMKK